MEHAVEGGGSGHLVAIEGIDGAGKSTQARLLAERLREEGRDAVVFREPGDSEHGRRIRELGRRGERPSPRQEMELFLRDRAVDVEENILPALRRGRVVVMDRYYFSSMAYQGARGIDVEEIRRANEAFAPRPAVTVVIDVPVGGGIDRINARRGGADGFEGEEYLESVRSLFLEMCDGDVVCVDGTETVEAVHERIFATVSETLSILPGRR